MFEALEHFAPHQQELRRRLIHCCLALMLTSTVAYFFKDQITAWCMHPLYLAYPPLGKLVYTKLTEAFISYLKLSMLVGIIVSFPFILSQIWLFIVPGLLDAEKQTIRRIVLWATLLFAGGASFAFFIVLPRMLSYFMSYASSSLIPMLKLGLYLTFTARMVLAFGVAFEIPFLMVMATRSGLISSDHFRKKRVYFYLAIVVLSFLLTTGELTATTLLSFPLFALYEAGIIAGRVFRGKGTLPSVNGSSLP
jgi:sec-independent protein translocase protein TatC